MSLDALKNKIKEKAFGNVAGVLMGRIDKLIEKMEELIELQKKTNELLDKISEKVG